MQKSPVCPKCRVFFATKEGRGYHKNPLLLDCGHTFCEGCLQKLAKENKTSISCPTCKVTTPVAGDVKNLWLDMYTTGMVVCSQKRLLDQELSKISPSFIMQSTKKKDIPGKSDNLCRECCRRMAACKCEKCDFIMCMQCFDKIHSVSNMLKQHQPVPLAAVDSDVEESPVCKEHDGRPIEYFCEDDNTPICSRCVIVGDHKKHSITSMEEKNKSVFADMEPALHTGNKVVKKLRKAERMMSELIPDIHSETASVIEELQTHFQELHGFLQAREKSLVETVYKTYREGIEPLTSMKEQMQEDMRKLEISVKAAQRVLNNNNEVTLHAKDILDELQRARELPCIVQEKKLENTEKIRFEPEETFITAIFGYGNVTGNVQSRANCYSINDMPEELMTEETDSVESIIADSISVVSGTDTATSEDVIVEDEQEVTFDSGSERGSIKSLPKSKTKKSAQSGPIPPKGRIKGGQDKVLVTHIHNPCQFKVQRCGDSGPIKALSRSINMWCRSAAASKEIPKEVQKDDFLLGKYSCDKEWYRVQVKQVMPGDNKNKTKLEVVYVDYGNSEVVGLESVRKMQNKFMKLPPFAMDCCLFDITSLEKNGRWSIESIQTFAKMTEGKPLIMIVVKEVNNVLHVDLSKPPDDDIQDDRPISVRDSLVFLEHANFISPSSSNIVGLAAPKRSFMMPAPVAVGESFGAFVTCAGDPSKFFIQRMGEESDYFVTLMKQMQDQYSIAGNQAWSIYCPLKDMICVCQYSGDHMWYRAKVIGVPGHKLVEVQYVDFGNTEVVHYDKLRKVLDIFIRLPVQAVNCKLSGVEADQVYTKEAKRWWAETVMMKHFILDVNGYTEGKLTVTLRDVSKKELSINQQIIREGYAAGTKMMPRPVSYHNIKSSEDSSGSYTSSKSGNFSDSSTSLSSKSSSRTTTPVPSLSGTSPRVSPTKKVSRSVTSPMKKAKSPGLSVDVDKAKARNTSPCKTPTSADPDSPAMMEVVISHFQSPSDFHVQLANSGENGLTDLMDDLQTTFELSEPEWVSWSVGTYCAAQYPDDGRWYRAKVLKVLHKNLIEVFMVDFGYYSQVTHNQLRPLQKKFLRQMCYAFRCNLADVVPAGDKNNWSRTACEFMMDEIKANKMYIQKKGEAKHESLPIDLLLEEHVAESALEPSKKNYYSLTEKIVDNGLGIPTKKRAVPQAEDKDEETYQPPVHRVYPVLEFLPPVPPDEGSVVTAIPSYVDYDGNIFIQQVISGDHTLQKLTERLLEKFLHSGPHRETIPWKVGQACVAHFHLDGLWYRAKIVKLEPPHRVKVFFVDFGNCEVVTTDKLRADMEEFIDIPQQCLECTLHDVEPISKDGSWPVALLNKVHLMIVSKPCCAEIVKKRDDLHLSINLMMDDRRDLGDALHKMGMVHKPNSIRDLIEQSRKISKTLEIKNPYKDITSLSAGQYFPVLVTHVELPNIVYFQHTRQSGSEMDELTDEINAQLSQLEKLAYELNQIGPTLPALPTPKQGLNCCAQFGFDKCWYRGVVVENDEKLGHVLVLYVDYGTSEYVTLDRVRALPHQFMDLPAQAVRLILNEVKPRSSEAEWTKDVLEAIIESVCNKELIGCLNKCKPTKGDLYVVGDSAGSALHLAYQSVVDRGLIKTPEESMLYNEALVGEISGTDDDQDVNGLEQDESLDISESDEDVIVEEEDVTDDEFQNSFTSNKTLTMQEEQAELLLEPAVNEVHSPQKEVNSVENSENEIVDVEESDSCNEDQESKETEDVEDSDENSTSEAELTNGIESTSASTLD